MEINLTIAVYKLFYHQMGPLPGRRGGLDLICVQCAAFSCPRRMGGRHSHKSREAPVALRPEAPSSGHWHTVRERGILARWAGLQTQTGDGRCPPIATLGEGPWDVTWPRSFKLRSPHQVRITWKPVKTQILSAVQMVSTSGGGAWDFPKSRVCSEDACLAHSCL